MLNLVERCLPCCWFHSSLFDKPTLSLVNSLYCLSVSTTTLFTLIWYLLVTLGAEKNTVDKGQVVSKLYLGDLLALVCKWFPEYGLNMVKSDLFSLLPNFGTHYLTLFALRSQLSTLKF